MISFRLGRTPFNSFFGTKFSNKRTKLFLADKRFNFAKSITQSYNVFGFMLNGKMSESAHESKIDSGLQSTIGWEGIIEIFLILRDHTNSRFLT